MRSSPNQLIEYFRKASQGAGRKGRLRRKRHEVLCGFGDKLKRIEVSILKVKRAIPVIGKRWIRRGKAYGAALVGFSLALIFLQPMPEAKAGETEILLLQTNNVTAHLFPCPT
jgi:hypothetical protein